uniref:Uncharacterized protein n=1 Tax=Glossina austeni TaxID=7395 RepID=A0A1A9V7S3_GLOAU
MSPCVPSSAFEVISHDVAFSLIDNYLRQRVHLHSNRRHLHHRSDHFDRGRCKHLSQEATSKMEMSGKNRTKGGGAARYRTGKSERNCERTFAKRQCELTTESRDSNSSSSVLALGSKKLKVIDEVTPNGIKSNYQHQKNRSQDPKTVNCDVSPILHIKTSKMFNLVRRISTLRFDRVL